MPTRHEPRQMEELRQSLAGPRPPAAQRNPPDAREERLRTSPADRRRGARPRGQLVTSLMVDVNLAEIDRELEELRSVEAAIMRIAEGSYGACDHCGRLSNSSGCGRRPLPSVASTARVFTSGRISTDKATRSDDNGAHCRPATGPEAPCSARHRRQEPPLRGRCARGSSSSMPALISRKSGCNSTRRNSTSRWSRYSRARRVPVLLDGDRHIWDSLAICEYAE